MGSGVQAIRSVTNERRSSYDTGHTFDTTNYELELNRTFTRTLGANGAWLEMPFFSDTRFHSVRGAMYPSVPSMPNQAFYGAESIRRTLPTKSPASLAEALIELKREGLPHLIGAEILKKGSLPGKLGSEFLNQEFGWKPLIRDVQSIASAAARSEEILKQYRRDSGRKIRRSWTFEPVIDIVEYPEKQGKLYIPNYTAFNNMFYNTGYGLLRETLKTERKYWFKGCYSYHLPSNFEGENLKGSIQRMNYLLGLELTPEVLWEVVPWSWLSDWFVNIGDVISNATNLQKDGLVLRYGYLMCTTTSERTLYLGNVRYNSLEPIGPVNVTYRTIRKERVRATPYGFGLNPDSFTNRQWAILAALGLTKGDKKLRYND